jgi:hypothetical protein
VPWVKQPTGDERGIPADGLACPGPGQGPGPGRPVAGAHARRDAARLRRRRVRALRLVKGTAGESTLAEWAGKSASVFKEEFSGVTKNLKKPEKSYGMCGDALADFWPNPEWAQALADRALVKAREAGRTSSRPSRSCPRRIRPHVPFRIRRARQPHFRHPARRHGHHMRVRRLRPSTVDHSARPRRRPRIGDPEMEDRADLDARAGFRVRLQRPSRPTLRGGAARWVARTAR